MKTINILFSSFALMAFGLVNAQTGTIQGKVLDDMKKPLPGVYVYVTNGASKVSTSTDSTGKYTLKPLNPGKYEVTFSMIAYNKVIISNINVTSNKISYANTEMEFGNTIGGIIVTAKRWERPLISIDEPTVEEMTSKEIMANVNRNDTKTLLTTTLPGIKLDPATNELSVRGARPVNTLYFVDGVKSVGGAFNLPGMGIGNVKVYTGGVPAKYGDVTGGVVVMETKSYFDLIKK